MIRRAALASAAIVFGLSGFAFLQARPYQPAGDFRPARGRTYLNPMGIALSADGRRAYVALSGVNVIATVDLESGRITQRTDTGNRPREVRREGSALVVADDDPEYLIIDLATGTAIRDELREDDDALSIRDVEVPLSQKLGAFGLEAVPEPAWDGAQQGRVTNQVFSNLITATRPSSAFRSRFSSTVSPSGTLGFSGGIAGNPITRFEGSLDTSHIGAADPADVAWSPSFRTLFVAASGSDAILAYPTKGIEAKVKAESQHNATFTGAIGFAGGNSQIGWGDAGRPVQLTVTPPVVLRTQANPRRMAMSEDGRLVVVSNTLADSLTVISLDERGARVVKHISLAGPPPDAIRRGEMLFHSSRLTFNGRFTCASCHPGGGSDGRVWDTPSEDPGPRRTKSLLGVAETAPYGWHGDSPTLADRVRKTITKLHRGSPTPGQVADLVAYLTSLPAPPPRPLDDDEIQLVGRGKTLFSTKARCARCHGGETYQDGELHDVGSGGLFRTPSLRGASERSRFLHDGSASSVDEIFKDLNDQKRHGAAHALTPNELKAVIAFVKAL